MYTTGEAIIKHFHVVYIYYVHLLFDIHFGVQMDQDFALRMATNVKEELSFKLLR